ncbi:AAA family ATPase [Tolypothrix campylonemoides VB511288]|nr:AAA family ATPase [Tolypothrix campylonemoides VB511288]
MPRFISPPLDQLSCLRTPLTLGERRVLDFFNKNLRDDWEIYIQPHLNGLRPDFVLLNPRVGIAVFEVKDWNLNAMRYKVQYSSKDAPELWATSRDGVDFRVTDNPVEKVIQYKDSIFNLYCPRLAIKASTNGGYLPVVTAGVILTTATTSQAKVLFQPFQKHLNLLGNKERYHPIVGIDALEGDQLDVVFPSALWPKSKFMDTQLADDLRHWLVEPDFASTQRSPLKLNSDQQKLATTRTKKGYRRIKGPAGSGKSLVLAARAAQLSTEKKDILVVTFNITLWHYLRDVAVRYQVSGKILNEHITWCHFHEWCKRVCFAAGFENEYRSLGWSEENLEETLEFKLIDLVNQALDKRKEFIPSYDAILVDEGQDYNLYWWNTLRKVRRDRGEMLLVADETQDLYERSKYWTDESMTGAGFTADWSRLKTSYRMPPTLIWYLEKYAKQYLPNTKIDIPEAENTELDLWPVQLCWIQVAPHVGTASICTDAVLKMFIWAEPETLAYSDITLLVQKHQFGLECIQLLEKNGVKTAHVFGETHLEQKNRKLGFFMGDARVKACTIHSFKGWESRCMVINIKHADSAQDLAAIYVALSRLKRHERGSYLTVVCSAPELAEFGETWPIFERL